MRLEFLHRLIAIVDEREARTLATAILGAEPEDGNGVFVRFVEFGELGAEFVFGDVRARRVEDVAVVGKGRVSLQLHGLERGKRAIVEGCKGELKTYTTICFLPRRGFRMNLRVRSVTGCSRSAMAAIYRWASEPVVSSCQDLKSFAF